LGVIVKQNAVELLKKELDRWNKNRWKKKNPDFSDRLRADRPPSIYMSTSCGAGSAPVLYRKGQLNCQWAALNSQWAALAPVPHRTALRIFLIAARDSTLI